MNVNPVFTSKYSAKERADLLSRMAAVFDAINSGQRIDGRPLDGRVMRALRTQGYINEDDLATERGSAWRMGYGGPVAPLASVTRLSTRAFPPTRKSKQPAPKPKPLTVARNLVAAGLIFVHPTLIDALNGEELALWLKAKRHERDRLTLAQLAAMLGEPLEATRIRAERCAERGYPLAVAQETDAA